MGGVQNDGQNSKMSARASIFIAEDDSALQELYMLALAGEFAPRVFADGDALFACLHGGQHSAPDLFILDVMLPGLSGLDIMARLKAGEFAHVPVIMVSALGDEMTKVRALNAGADDYIAKPFGVMELTARVKVALRKQVRTEKHGDITLCDTRHEITAAGSALTLTKKEYALLHLLVEKAGAGLEREERFARVWGAEFIGETRTLDIHVKELRRKLAAAGSTAEIRTIRGVGYMLV
jgi:two-component system alkaline phosphatase synthesis response regulator PhoP